MIRIIFIFLTFLIFSLNAQEIFAQNNSFVSIVNPIRGSEFWELKDQSIDNAVKGQSEILTKYNLSATWLLRIDALDSKEILDLINKRSQDEKGLFLEITPRLTNLAKVNYHKSENWHDAGSAFLSGYERFEREKIIDASFEKFREVFGYYPSSVGAWWIDAYSLEYMQRKYDIVASLIVADQYTTDNYQIWGQFWSTPYYPSKRNALHPAPNMDDKLSVVIMQWAARDPVNAYGNGVGESTYSVQANDYLDYHNLDINYFKKLLDIYLGQKLNKFGHIVIGLENSYDWSKYSKEYENQIKIISEQRRAGILSTATMSEFSSWYRDRFPDLSPEHIVVSEDPLGTDKKVVWFMNLNYRAGWFFNQDGSVFRDIHQYTGGEEICFLRRCDEVNFATGATRVLDEVSFGHKWVIDQGEIKEFKVSKINEKYIISYQNEAGNLRKIEFLQRDLGIDGKTYSIDYTILEATRKIIDEKVGGFIKEKGSFEWSITGVFLKIFKFLLFIVFLIMLPGYVICSKISKDFDSVFSVLFLSTVIGMVTLTLVFYLLSIFNIKFLIFSYSLIFALIFLKLKLFRIRNFGIRGFSKFGLIISALILSGTIFQTVPTFKNGLLYPYGLGFWGPNTHDGIWHISLINQLSTYPFENPIFAGNPLKNYHFFYDLLIAITSFLSNIPVTDLVFRFYPVLFSLILGIGTYYIIVNLFKGKINQKELNLASLIGIYLVYFSGSFGWIVEYLKSKSLGGESAFWANQSISFNLNPPFAISLIIIIAIFQLLNVLRFQKGIIILLAILCGTLVSFKAYAAVLILVTLFIISIIKKSLPHFVVFIASSVLSVALFFSNFSISTKLFIFSPFWFIHSMIDSPDRVGWVRLSLARNTGLETGNWFKFIVSEIVGFSIFLVGNMGTRVFALLSLFKIKYIFSHTTFLTLFIFSILALFIPILFIQAGNPWNTIQFLYYFLYVSAVLSGVVLSNLFLRLNKIVALIFIGIILVLTPINSWATANGYLTYNPHAYVSKLELEALNFLGSKEDGIVLTFPYDKNLKQKLAEPWSLMVYDSTAYVSALSKKKVFVEDEPQNQILLTDYKKRIVASYDFFIRSGLDKKNFLRDNNIKYIYVPKIYKIQLNETDLQIEKIFENEEVLIFKVKET